jgi:hypothetical protein
MNEVAMKIPTAILDNLKSRRVVRSVVVEKGVKIDAAALLCHQWTTARITNRSITEGDMIRINHMGMHLILREEEEVTNLSVESEVQATMIRVDATVQMGGMTTTLEVEVEVITVRVEVIIERIEIGLGEVEEKGVLPEV